ncbi:toxin-antitoxin system YwqK family antitoxin [Streptomyces sp. NBC_01187]|uniref:toxin-antitoxin system YwqK family antitoxin n=1 Tax=Streptomyces sp. NBC_01187 TaxID=2903766 RepID=UPI00386E5384|nr:hypothetical protein OG220_19810 [Streptomyces sp. NBC_01187]
MEARTSRPQNVPHLPQDETEMCTDLMLYHDGAAFTGVNYTVSEEGRLLDETSYWWGAQDGPDLEWWPSGLIRAEGVRRHGVAVGWWREWYEDGWPAEESLLAEEVQVRRRWSADGELVMDFVSSRPEARKAAETHPARRRRTTERCLRTDELGTYDWFVAGYEGAPFTGIAVECDRDGRLLGTTSYREGIEDGVRLELWPTGRKREQGSCRAGVVVGWWCQWDSDGNLVEETLFDDDGKHLLIRRWGDDGALARDSVAPTAEARAAAVAHPPGRPE